MPVDVDKEAEKVILSEQRPIDLLNRQETIDNIMYLLNVILDTKSSYTFALNGKWGTGKSFVLSMLEEELLTYQAGEKYLVFHYNCWKYDYYDEPLFAIVAALLEGIDEETHFFSKRARENAQAAFKVAKPALRRMAGLISTNLVGADLIKPVGFWGNIKKAFHKAKQDQNQKKEQDDPFFGFNNTLKSAQKQLQSLTKDRTIVVVVDELDRCLPTYAIKVLERLHHLFYGMENCVVVLAVAKDQLDHTIRQVFGNEIDINQYLKKFIDFQMELDIGTIQGGFSQKYEAYFSMFDETLIQTDFNFEEYFSSLFYDLDIRTQEHLMEHITTIHRFLFPEGKKDYSFLCFELLWMVFKKVYKQAFIMPIRVQNGKFLIQSYASKITTRNAKNYKSANSFLQYFIDKCSGIQLKCADNVNGYSEGYVFEQPIDIPQLILYYWSHMDAFQEVEYQLMENTPRLSEYQKNIMDFNGVDRLLEIIK